MQPTQKWMNVPEPIRAAMQRTNELFIAEVAMNCNFEALNRVYMANARVLPPGAPMVGGHEQIKEFWEAGAPLPCVYPIRATDREGQD